MGTVHTARGEGRITETETRWGNTWHRVAGEGFDVWVPAAQVRTASPQDGWEPIPDDEVASPYSDPMPVEEDPGFAEDPTVLGPGGGEDGDFGNELDALAEFASTGEVGPEAMAEFGGSPGEGILGGLRLAEGFQDDFARDIADGTPDTPDQAKYVNYLNRWDNMRKNEHHEYRPGPEVEGFEQYHQGGLYLVGGPGDNVDHSNSVALPYNPDPQHDAVAVTPDASWGPGEESFDADERLHPADSLDFDTVSTSEAGPYPGPAPHLFAGAIGDPTPHQTGPHGLGPDDPELREYATFGDDEGEDTPYEDGGSYVAYDPELMGSWDGMTPLDREELEVRYNSPNKWRKRFDNGSTPGPFGGLVDGTVGDLVEHKHGLYRPAGLDDRYADILITADHYNDPVQMFRDDPNAFIERRGSAAQGHDPEADHYGSLVDSDSMIRQAAWRDVQAKAKRLRREGRITVKDLSPDRIYATVQGDNGTYETLITKGSSLGGYDAFESHGPQHVGNWHCSCKWGDWAFKRRFTFIGRLCSHGLASYWEMQSAHQARRADEAGYRRKPKVKRGRQADLLRTTPGPLTPGLNFIDYERESKTVDVTSLDDIEPRGASDDTANDVERQAARHLGRRLVALLVDEVVPEFEQWFAQNRGMEVNAAPVEEVTSAAGDFAREAGLDQGTTEMLQEWINSQFTPEDAREQEPSEEIEHFQLSAGRYLMAVVRTADAASNPLDAITPPTTPDPVSTTDPLGDVLGAPDADTGSATPAAADTGSATADYKDWYGGGDAADTGTGSYTVQEGDTLSDIAQSQGMGGDWQSLYDQNKDTIGGDANLIQPGQELTMPETAHGGSGAAAGPGAPGAPAGDLFSPANTSTGLSTPAAPAGSPAQGPGLNNDMPGVQGPGLNGDMPATPARPVQGPGLPAAGSPPLIGPTNDGNPATGLPYGPGGPTVAPAAPSSVGFEDLLNPKRRSSRRQAYILASDESLLNHLRELAESPADDHGHMQERNDDVRDTIDQLRERGYDASQLVASLRTADGLLPGAQSLNDQLLKKYPGSDIGGYNPVVDQPWDEHGTGAALDFMTSDPAQAQQVMQDAFGNGAQYVLWDQKQWNPDGSTSPMDDRGSPTENHKDHLHINTGESGEGGGGGSSSGGSSSGGGSSSSGGGGIGQSVGGPSPEMIGGDGVSLPGGSAGTSAPSSGSDDEGSGEGPMGDFADFIGGGGIGDLGDAFSGAASGVTDVVDSLRGLMGSRTASDDDGLLGEPVIDDESLPTSFAGFGPDHQHWATSAEDYVNAHEKGKRQDVTSFADAGDLIKYSAFDRAVFEATLHEANAFDDYADWGYAETDSADPDDWGSPSTFLDKATEEDWQGASTERAQQEIEDRLRYVGRVAGPAAEMPTLHEAAGSDAGYFGVGAQPKLPNAEGITHSNGAANLKSVTKPKKVKPPKAPKLPQVAQPAQETTSVPPLVPQNPQAVPQAAPAKPKQKATGGIQRQAVQVGAGTLAPVFANMGSAPAPGPVRTSPWDDEPVYTAAAQSQMDQVHGGGQVKAAALRDDFAPAVGDYGHTDDASEIVRQFQASMGGQDWATSSSPTGVGDFDISAGAHQFLARTAGRVYSQAEQASLEGEYHPQGARNLGELDLNGTHYMGL